MILEFLRGKPNKWFKQLKESFNDEYDSDHYDYFQYVLDCYTLESEYRQFMYTLNCLNGRRMSLIECVEFIKNTVIPDIFSLQKRYYTAFDDLSKKGILTISDNDFEMFSNCWDKIKNNKYRTVKFLESLMNGNIVRGNYNISSLFETFNVSLENACQFAEKYCLYAREKVDEIEYIYIEKGLTL